MRQILVMALFLSLVACSSVGAGKKPSWIEGQSESYSPNRYIVGVASASSRDQAADRARAEISKVFEARVSSRFHTNETYSGSKKSGQAESGEMVTRLQRNMTVSTQQVISGIEVPETWQDKASRSWYALAVLSRTQAEQVLASNIHDLDRAIDALMSDAENGTSAMQAVSDAADAKALFEQRQDLQKKYQVVDISGVGMPSKLSANDMQRFVDTQMSALGIQIAVDGSHLWLAAPLESALQQAHIRLNGDKAKYTLKVSMEEQLLGKRDGWFWLRAVLDVQLLSQSGEAISDHRWSMKVSATTEDLLPQRLRNESQKKISAELIDEIFIK